MKKFVRTIFLMLVLIELPPACSKTPNKMSPLIIDYIDGTTVQLSENISFLVDNPNNICIIFPYDFGAKIFYKQNSTLHEIKNVMVYSPKDNIVLDAKGSHFSSQVLTIKPDLSDNGLSGPTNSMVEISGYTCKTNKLFSQEIRFIITP